MKAGPRSPSIRLHSGTSGIRTIEEALRQLRALLPKLGLPPIDAQTIGVRAFPMRLPDGEPTTSIALIIPRGPAGETFAFLLPSSARFTAKTSLGERRVFEANLIHGAKVEPDRHDVQLADGTYLHDLEFGPIKQAKALTRRQLQVLQQVINSVGAHEQCFRPMIYSRVGDHSRHRSTSERASDRRLRSELAHLQNQQWLDFNAVKSIKLPKMLKAIERVVVKSMPNINRTELTDTLAAAGLRKPRSGPKSNRGSA